MEKDKKLSVAFVTFEKYEGRKDIASSRIRAEWLCNNWDEAEIYKQGKKYDVLIFQKAYWWEMAEKFDGIKIFDLCDPDFLHWGHHTKDMLENVDYVTTSTEELAKQLSHFSNVPVVCVPDRIEFKEHVRQKIHRGRAKNVVWFGYSDNFPMIDPVFNYLEKYKLNLIVISNKNYLAPYHMVRPEIEVGMSEKEIQKVLEQQDKKFWINVTNLKWTRETVNNDILKGDIVINPTSTKGKWKYKSNNKTLTAWALGMPVAQNVDDLERLLDHGERIKEAEKYRVKLKENYDVKQSVEDYKSIISEIENDKFLNNEANKKFKEYGGGGNEKK